eukprot:6213963-Pleurochrysis_carterae.AAC.2
MTSAGPTPSRRRHKASRARTAGAVVLLCFVSHPHPRSSACSVAPLQVVVLLPQTLRRMLAPPPSFVFSKPPLALAKQSLCETRGASCHEC